MLPAEIVMRLSAAALTYGEVGFTSGVLPPGYRHLSHTVNIGSGPGVFETAAEAVLTWQVHLQTGLRVSSSSVRARPGTAVMLGLGIGPVRLIVPCRVVYVVDDSHRRGFAYGTLPGHPESGEESFIVERHDDDTVTFAVTAFSRPATRLAKAAGPIGRVVQRRITDRYLRAFAE
jgi:uncharacterized protein (UPF0548 family)